MNYRHAYHAGNFADVLKHSAMVAILSHLRRKETPFAVIDTHAGRGLYTLDSAEAAKTGEAQGGIGKILAAASLPAPLDEYAELVRGLGANEYPGSPLLAVRCLRAQDRLIAIEKHEEEAALLTAALRPYRNAQAMTGDGYAALTKLTPPRERRGLVLIDPPYEVEDEWAQAIAALIAAHRRFATGIYCLWYPAKDWDAREAAIGEILNSGIARLLQIELELGAGDDAPRAPGQGPRLTATGLLVVNPPFGFSAAMEASVSYLAEILGRGPGARGTVTRLAGDV